MIYLARHGETVWNRDQRFQGQLDSPLTPRGLDQARRMGETLARRIRERAGWAVVASPLGRAQHTARIVAGVLGIADARIETDRRLAEVDFGSWAGLSHEEIEACSPGALDGATQYDWQFRSPDGETYEAMRERIAAWLAETGMREKLIVVAHGVTGRILRGIYLGLSKEAGLELEAPQDAIFHLSGGAAERISCPGW
jgi:broad specificity phosphatase PhoE